MIGEESRRRDEHEDEEDGWEKNRGGRTRTRDEEGDWEKNRGGRTRTRDEEDG